jgi:hypothetical protein
MEEGGYYFGKKLKEINAPRDQYRKCEFKSPSILTILKEDAAKTVSVSLHSIPH